MLWMPPKQVADVVDVTILSLMVTIPKTPHQRQKVHRIPACETAVRSCCDCSLTRWVWMNNRETRTKHSQTCNIAMVFKMHFFKYNIRGIFLLVLTGDGSFFSMRCCNWTYHSMSLDRPRRSCLYGTRKAIGSRSKECFVHCKIFRLHNSFSVDSYSQRHTCSP